MINKLNVCCRFAPAPTGSLHLGSAHTAFFVWLFVKHHKGKYILRLEDSDQTNTSIEAQSAIIDELKWLGLIEENKKIIIQSTRINEGIYNRMYLKLKKKGLIREVDDNSGRGKAYEYIPPEKKIIVNDFFRGDIPISYSDSSESQLSPFIILRNDGYPVYNFACVVDDIQMGITHVIRGDDILPNTAKQISLYNALEAPLPVFAHLSRVLDIDGKPMSKRRGSKAISQFKQEGYLPEAILNYLAQLGWSSPSGNEILSINQIIKEFTLDRVNISTVKYDPSKLNYINGRYIRQLDTESLVKKFKQFIKENKLSINFSDEWLFNFCKFYASRCNTFSDLYDNHLIYTIDTIKYDYNLFINSILFPEAISFLNECTSLLDVNSEFNDSFINELKSISEKNSISFKHSAQCIRVVLMNSNQTPDLLAIFTLLGKEKAKSRIFNCIELLRLLDWSLIQLLNDFILQCQSLYDNAEKIINDKIKISNKDTLLSLSDIIYFLKNKIDYLLEIKNNTIKDKLLNSK